MNLYSIIFSPISICFFIAVLGMLIGKIKIRGISLDLSAVLIVAVIVGTVLKCSGLFDRHCSADEINSYMQMLSSLGTAMFVSAIGLSAGYSINLKCKGKLAAAAVSVLMTVAAFAAMVAVYLINTDVQKSTLFGLFCGALTTTPGLSAVYEGTGAVATEASLGYGSAYLFGVVFTVLSVQMIVGKQHKSERSAYSSDINTKRPAVSSLIQLSLVILLGRVLGGITLPVIDFSLGASGGMLCAGLLIGWATGRFFTEKIMPKEHSGILRSFGLVMFFVGNGFPSGLQMGQALSPMWVAIGAVLTVTPVLIGWAVCRLVLHMDRVDTAAIISGGMTSTPAIGVLSVKADISYDKYSCAYVGALITIILLIRGSFGLM